jgi:AraC-like DNA-binding protein
MTRAKPGADTESGSVYLSYARALFDYLTEHGQPLAPLLKGTSLTPADFDDSDRSIPASLYVTLWQRAVVQTGDDYLGLHVGEVVRPGKYGILGYAMMSCETLGQAVLRQMRYQDLIGKAGRSELVTTDDHAEMHWHSSMARLSRPVGEEHLASWVAFARWMLGAERSPTRVSFEHAAPAALDEYRRIFRCELAFDQPNTAIRFPQEYLSAPIKDKNPALRRMLDEHAEALLAKRSTADPARDIRDAIQRALVNGVPAIETVAEQLQVHTRTLQRRLSDIGLTYKQLLDDVRSALALQYIKDPKLGLLDIAFLLGFAEQSSFQRAFKRWTGQPPGHYRGGKQQP